MERSAFAIPVSTSPTRFMKSGRSRIISRSSSAPPSRSPTNLSSAWPTPNHTGRTWRRRIHPKTPRDGAQVCEAARLRGAARGARAYLRQVEFEHRRRLLEVGHHVRVLRDARAVELEGGLRHPFERLLPLRAPRRAAGPREGFERRGHLPSIFGNSVFIWPPNHAPASYIATLPVA